MWPDCIKSQWKVTDRLLKTKIHIFVNFSFTFTLISQVEDIQLKQKICMHHRVLQSFVY